MQEPCGPHSSLQPLPEAASTPTLADLWPAGNAGRKRPSGLCCHSASWCLESRESRFWRAQGPPCTLGEVWGAKWVGRGGGLRGSADVGGQWGWGSRTCHVGRQPIHLHLLLPQRVTAIAQTQGRDCVGDQYQP